MKLTLKARHLKGRGRASAATNRKHRREFYTSIFGMPVLGTYNLDLERPVNWKELPPFRTGVEQDPKRGEVEWKFWLVKLSVGKRSVYGYALHWEGTRMPLSKMEVLSKTPILFGSDDKIELEIFGAWSRDQIEAFNRDVLTRKDKFQSYEWIRPKRADSNLVWSHFQNLKFSGRKCLDIGCNIGFFSSKLCKAGAIVTAVDKSARSIDLARTIQEHIEGTDIRFEGTEGGGLFYLDESRSFDYIFYLSVHHQIDPGYVLLGDYLRHLKRRCGKLCLELIDPSPEMNGTDPSPIVASVGGRVLRNRYKHKVRKRRSIYIIES